MVVSYIKMKKLNVSHYSLLEEMIVMFNELIFQSILIWGRVPEAIDRRAVLEKVFLKSRQLY